MTLQGFWRCSPCVIDRGSWASGGWNGRLRISGRRGEFPSAWWVGLGWMLGVCWKWEAG